MKRVGVMQRDDAENRAARRLGWVGLVCLCSLVLPAATTCQTERQSTSREEGEAVISCGIPLIGVEVEVKDVNGLPVSNLSHDKFRVYEDGKRQKINFFTDERESELAPIKYKLGYYPPLASADWEFRRIRVKVRNSKVMGLSVKCDPEGYFAPPRDWGIEVRLPAR